MHRNSTSVSSLSFGLSCHKMKLEIHSWSWGCSLSLSMTKGWKMSMNAPVQKCVSMSWILLRPAAPFHIHLGGKNKPVTGYKSCTDAYCVFKIIQVPWERLDLLKKTNKIAGKGSPAQTRNCFSAKARPSVKFKFGGELSFWVHSTSAISKSKSVQGNDSQTRPMLQGMVKSASSPLLPL